MTTERVKAINEWLGIHCPKCAYNDDRGTDFVNCQAECEVQKDIGIVCIHYEEAHDIEPPESMQIVIEIPKEMHKALVQGSFGAKYNMYDLVGCVMNGILLPKGHGKLIDSNVLWDAFQDLGQDFYEAFDFAEANAVIEADEGGDTDGSSSNDT